MFVNKLSHISRTHISKSKRCFNVKSLVYYFHMKTKIFADFQICTSVSLNAKRCKVNHILSELCHERNIYLIDHSKKIKPNHLSKGQLHLNKNGCPL